MSYKNWKHILECVFSFHNSIFNGISIIKTIYGSHGQNQLQLLTLFFFPLLGSVSLVSSSFFFFFFLSHSSSFTRLGFLEFFLFFSFSFFFFNWVWVFGFFFFSLGSSSSLDRTPQSPMTSPQLMPAAPSLPASAMTLPKLQRTSRS